MKRIMTNNCRLLKLSIACLVTFSECCLAGGTYLPAKGAIGVGLGNAGGPARANDGSTVFFNPAGMTQLGGIAQFGTDFLATDISIGNQGSTATTPGTGGTASPYQGGGSGNPDSIATLPNAYIVYPLQGSDIWLGLAITAPFGLEFDYPTDWFGRYDSLKTELLTINVAPSIAYKIGKEWSIGLGIDIQYADGKLSSALPDPLNPGGPTTATDGFSVLKGDDWSLGFNVGVTWQPLETTRIGLHYRSEMNHELDGSVTITGLTGPLQGFNGKVDAKTGLDLPAIISLGLAQTLSPSVTLYLDANWFGWDSFDELRVKLANASPDIVRPQHFSNTWAIASGVNYKVNDRWEVRSGIQFDQTPTTDSWRNTSIPDGNLIWVGVGLTHNFTNGVSIDVGYEHGFLERANINIDQLAYAGTPLESVVNVSGRTDNKADVFALALRYWFD